MKKIAVYGRRFDTRFTEQVQQLFDLLARDQVKILVHKKFSRFLSETIRIENHDTFSTSPELTGCDMMFSIGGDGTMLDTVTFVRNSGLPVLGFNTGRLGFLSGIPMESVEETLNMLKSGQYTLDKRSLLTIRGTEEFGDNNFALNELTLHKKDSATMMTVHAYINNNYLNTYWADGLIVSTPTGSTAYSLSCAGPIMLPDSENFVITPIAPHNLNVRPVVIPDKSEVKLRLEGRSENYLVSLDARSQLAGEGTEIVITKADFTVSLIRLNNQDFLETLRSKLMWGLDLRN